MKITVLIISTFVVSTKEFLGNSESEIATFIFEEKHTIFR